ncbi:MAG TPA: T9SS type A sorting domain-containing protein, partial [Flavitalea sp.]|nr:T9SS type A sorting domain-containing protein [Flavitalea sp.]
TPNPFRGAITVFLSEVPQRPANVEVLDSRGRLMYRTTMRNNVSTIYPAGLKQGFYILKAIVNGKTVSIPIIVR